MAFAVAIPRSKRINMIDDQLNEHLDKKDALDTSHLQLLDEQTQRKEGQKDEATVSPMEAHDKFASAMGEMDVVLDLITNLENARFMDYRVLQPRSRVNAIQEAVNDRLVRTGRRRAALSAAAERLHRGADALRAVAARDNTFYTQITALQRYWRIRVNPATSQYAGAPFSVEIAFAEPSALASSSATGAAGIANQFAATQGRQGAREGGDSGSAGLAAAQQLVVTVPLYKDPVTGVVRIQVEAEESADAVAARSSLVHPTSPHDKDASRPPGAQGGPNSTQPAEADASFRGGKLVGTGPSAAMGTGAGSTSGAGEAGGMKVAVGVKAVHTVLMQLQQRLLWQVAARSLEADAAAGAMASPFMHSLARKVIARLAHAPSPAGPSPPAPSAGGTDTAGAAQNRTVLRTDIRAPPHPWDTNADMLALRPLTLEQTVSCRVPSATIPPQPRPYVTPLHALPLLPDLAAAISHAHFRHQLRAQLEAQAYQLPGVTLHWVPTTRAATSALRVHVAPHANFLITVQDSMVEVEGVGLGGGGAATRWAKDSAVTLQRTELPRLLYWLAGLSQEDGVPPEEHVQAAPNSSMLGLVAADGDAGQGVKAEPMEVI